MHIHTLICISRSLFLERLVTMDALIGFLVSVHPNMLNKTSLLRERLATMGELISYLPVTTPTLKILNFLHSSYLYNKEYMHIGERFKGIIYTYLYLPIFQNLFLGCYISISQYSLYFIIASDALCKATFNRLSMEIFILMWGRFDVLEIG